MLLSKPLQPQLRFSLPNPAKANGKLTAIEKEANKTNPKSPKKSYHEKLTRMPYAHPFIREKPT
jgi:hypothetical protein